MTVRLFKYKLPVFIFLACLQVLIAGCGKKGTPTLSSFETPAPPTAVRAVHREDSIILSWTYPGSRENLIAEFVVVRSTGPGSERLSNLTKDQRIFIDKSVTAGSEYEYRILSRNFRGAYSDASAVVTASVVRVPGPPKNLSYSVAGNSLTIRWDPLHEVDGSVLYNVYKSSEKGDYGLTPLNSSPLSSPVFTDIFSVNAPVRYIVRGLRGSEIRNEGRASEELMVDPADLVPQKPVDLQAYAASDRVLLSWSAFSDVWVIGFNVYRKTGESGFALIGNTQLPAFTDHDVPSTKRDYRVTAMGPKKEGPAAEILDVIHIPQR
jgi:hypothetical protein